MKRVLQAGHWKSLNTSMTIGAFLEPDATWRSMSGTEAADWPALTPSADVKIKPRTAARHRGLTLRKRSTQSFSVKHLYITRPGTKILPVIRSEKKVSNAVHV